MSKSVKAFSLIFICLLMLSTVSCQKKVISSDVGGQGSYSASQGSGSGGSSADADDKAARDRQKAIEEERLKEEQLREEEKNALLAAKEAFENEDIYFEYDSSVLSQEARQLLLKKAEWLEKNPRASITIEGHTDERGNTEYNLALGDRRAETVKDFLAALGISASRLETVSYGEERPIDFGHDEAAWQKNRRAHLSLH